jgi:hypothetical protein
MLAARRTEPMTTTTTTASTTTFDEAKLQAFLGRAIGDFGAAASAALVVLSDKLGLYRTLAEAGPLNSAELAERSGTVERYVREWLVNQAAAGDIDYDSTSQRYSRSLSLSLSLSPSRTCPGADR